MSSSTSAAVSALLDVVVVSAVAPERAEFELTPTRTRHHDRLSQKEILEEGSLMYMLYTGDGSSECPTHHLPFHSLNWSLYQIVRQLPPRRTAGTATWCGGGEPGVTQVAAERAGGPVTVQEGYSSCAFHLPPEIDYLAY
ncbi:hypothetical protein JB92DRAFT_2829883 [Gautieria morchelliformis]|nr:hypothetical protein JB92DRAFT_2829883 [Gautieria morchelliformis]